MSYKTVVISDNPVAYYKLDDSGSTAFDSSECNNSGSYNGTKENGHLPLVLGNLESTKITNLVSVDFSILNDYSVSQRYSTFATADSSKNPFTLEAWIYPVFTTSSIAPIIADAEISVGLFWENGNIVFQVGEERLDYTVEYLNRIMHIVATYDGSTINLYLDGYIKASRYIDRSSFTNESISFSCGPTQSSSDYMLVNNISFYRYSLTDYQIKNHYNASFGMDPLQIVLPDNGDLFHLYDNSISTKYVYSYPGNKSLLNFMQTGLYYDQAEKYLEILKGSGDAQSITITDFISIPSGVDIDDSIIEWEGSNGVTVQTSVDDITYVDCINNHSIPQYSIDNGIDESRGLYIKITLSTSDDSKYIPRFKFLSIAFYKNQMMYSSTSTDYFSKTTDIDGVLAESNLGNSSYQILSRDDRNGVRPVAGAGFCINTSKNIKSLEFFYTPYSLEQSGLIASSDLAETYFNWGEDGTISSLNIDSIYVNGANKTSETFIQDLFKANEIHHVVITFTDKVSGKIGFNYIAEVIGIDPTPVGLVEALYQNIAIYRSDISSLANQHYNLYVGRDSVSISDMSMSMTESGVKEYNINWTVVQSS